MLTSSIQQINTLFYILSNKAYIILSYLIAGYVGAVAGYVGPVAGYVGVVVGYVGL